MSIREDIELRLEALADEYAGPRFSARHARLYSQNLRVQSGADPLRSWTDTDGPDYWSTALSLIQLAESPGLQPDAVRRAYQRAAETLEWLHTEPSAHEYVPLGQLAAACYQLADLPARAQHMARLSEGAEGGLIGALLSGDIAELQREVVHLADTLRGSADLDSFLVEEIAAAFGVIAAFLRWGSTERLDDALMQLGRGARAMKHVAPADLWLTFELSARLMPSLVQHAARNWLQSVAEDLSDGGKIAMERYSRQGFQKGRTTAWPSQRDGYAKLLERSSFGMCTPTGSGKTAIAEVALIQGLFSRFHHDEGVAPVCLYLVPTRALAAEVERTLTQALGRLADLVQVSALYGGPGSDKGPADGVLDDAVPTVVVCTQEKADSLLRVGGDTLLSRMSLVVVDEAHAVGAIESADQIESGEARSLRLESLVARLKARLGDAECRFVALSAVLYGGEERLSRWIAGDDGEAVTSQYRSTRQLVGRLQCKTDRTTDIRWDMVDGVSVNRKGLPDEVRPYVPRALPRMPESTLAGSQKGLAPYALWAAMHLRTVGTTPGSALISVAEGVGNFAGWFLELIESEWAEEQVVRRLRPYVNSPRRELAWHSALARMEDYFGTASKEYRLLRHGIVVHHSRMPTRLSRALVELLELKVARLCIATSTLTEGVNLPFDTIIVPQIRRNSGSEMSPSEFANLAGRAGRPGVSSEGRVIVLQPTFLAGQWQHRQFDKDYLSILRAITRNDIVPPQSSSIAAVVQGLVGGLGLSEDELWNWLETTAPSSETPVDNLLAALDGQLAAVVEEAEDDVDLEVRLRDFWRQSFASVRDVEDGVLEEVVSVRGQALRTLYGESLVRRSYKAGMAPRDTASLETIVDALRQQLDGGTEYLAWEPADQVEFVSNVVEVIASHPRFTIKDKPNKAAKATWNDVLAWWLAPDEAPRKPTAAGVAGWHDFVSNYFGYRVAWGISSVLAAFEMSQEHTQLLTSIKELLQWGTLEPVAAYLLATGAVETRDDAELRAYEYHGEVGYGLETISQERLRALNPRGRRPRRRTNVRLPLGAAVDAAVRVLPRPTDEGGVRWFDVVGNLVGEAPLPEGVEWQERWFRSMDFVANGRAVVGTPYLA